MGRTFSAECIVLRRYRVGEIHKGIVLLTENRGILHAIAHGALRPGSRLAGGSEPLTLARSFFYHEPVKDSYKVTDISVISEFARLKADFLKYLTASVWTEALLRSFGGGVTDASVFTLLRDSLQILEAAEGSGVDRADLQFLWRFLGLAGFRPDTDVCSLCGSRVPEEEPMHRLAGSRTLACSACAARNAEPRLEMSPGARRYLAHTLRLGSAQAARVGLATGAARSLRRLTAELLQSILEAPLKSLQAGAGIL